MRWTDDLIVVSEDLQPYFWNTYRRNTVYIGNGPAGYDISDPTFSFGYSLGLKPNRYLVFLGRLVPEKNLHLLIQACKPLLADGWKLAIVGACSDTSEYCCTLKNMAQGSQNIVFTGYLGGEKLAEIMRGAGLFVLPSSVEGQPLALLEAMAERLPVLASDIPIHQRLLGDGRGILFRDGDQCSLAEMIQKAIYTSPMKMKEMANQAYQYIQSHHNWDQIVDRHLSLYRGKSSASTQPLEDVIIAQ